MTLPQEDSQLMNHLVRMVVPMRREFKRSLDVLQFLHDFAYAREVLDQALGSLDAQLLEHAKYVERRLYGARTAAAPAAGPPSAETVPAEKKPPPVVEAAQTEEELRAKVMRKYTTGLR